MCKQGGLESPTRWRLPPSFCSINQLY